MDLMRHIWLHGDERIDRTGVGTRSILGATLRFSLAGDAVPLLTTKRVYWKVAAREMLWFLTGDTNIRELVRQGVHIWTDWPLDAYRRATGEAIDRDSFEARIIDETVKMMQESQSVVIEQEREASIPNNINYIVVEDIHGEVSVGFLLETN